MNIINLTANTIRLFSNDNYYLLSIPGKKKLLSSLPNKKEGIIYIVPSSLYHFFK